MWGGGSWCSSLYKDSDFSLASHSLPECDNDRVASNVWLGWPGGHEGKIIASSCQTDLVLLNGSHCPVPPGCEDKVVMVGRGEILVKQSMPKLHCRLGVTERIALFIWKGLIPELLQDDRCRDCHQGPGTILGWLWSMM